MQQSNSKCQKEVNDELILEVETICKRKSLPYLRAMRGRRPGYPRIREETPRFYQPKNQRIGEETPTFYHDM